VGLDPPIIDGKVNGGFPFPCIIILPYKMSVELENRMDIYEGR